MKKSMNYGHREDEKSIYLEGWEITTWRCNSDGYGSDKHREQPEQKALVEKSTMG